MPSAVARRRAGLEHDVVVGRHELIADEPEQNGGADAGPTPTELLAGALASCTSITLLMYAERKGWDLGQIEVSVDYETPKAGQSARIECAIRIPADLDDEQLAKLETIATRCPVHRTLAGQAEITDTITAGTA